MEDKEVKDFIKKNYANSPSTFILTELMKIYLTSKDESIRVETLVAMISYQNSLEQLIQPL